MESTLAVDQDALIRAVQNAVEAKSFKLQDGKEVLVCQGQIVAEAQPRVRPALSRVDVESLASLAQIANTKGVLDESRVGEDFVIRVVSPSQVYVIDVKQSEKHQVVAIAGALLPTASVLRNYVSLEQALTEIRECFEQGEMIESLADTLRTTKIENITELTDNGMGMNVSVKSRVSNGKQADSTAFNLELTPIRTFAEVEALPGVFTMRWKRDGDKINVRLIEQQSHRWRHAQMSEIKSYLQKLLPEATILL